MSSALMDHYDGPVGFDYGSLVVCLNKTQTSKMIWEKNSLSEMNWLSNNQNKRKYSTYQRYIKYSIQITWPIVNSFLNVSGARW